MARKVTINTDTGRAISSSGFTPSYGKDTSSNTSGSKPAAPVVNQAVDRTKTSSAGYQFTPQQTERLQSYVSDPNKAQSEIQRAKDVYAARTKAGDTAGAQAAHNWANQIREATGVSSYYDAQTGAKLDKPRITDVARGLSDIRYAPVAKPTQAIIPTLKLPTSDDPEIRAQEEAKASGDIFGALTDVGKRREQLDFARRYEEALRAGEEKSKEKELTYDQALERAERIVKPRFQGEPYKASQAVLRRAKERGFFGQLPVALEEAEAVGNVGAQQQAAIVDLAQRLVEQSQTRADSAAQQSRIDAKDIFGYEQGDVLGQLETLGTLHAYIGATAQERREMKKLDIEQSKADAEATYKESKLKLDEKVKNATISKLNTESSRIAGLMLKDQADRAKSNREIDKLNYDIRKTKAETNSSILNATVKKLETTGKVKRDVNGNITGGVTTSDMNDAMVSVLKDAGLDYLGNDNNDDNLGGIYD